MEELEKKKEFVHIPGPLNPKLGVTPLLEKNLGTPVYVEKIENSPYPLVANLWSTRERIAWALNCKKEKLLHLLLRAVEHPGRCEEVDAKPECQKISEKPDLSKLPILTHYSGDGGPYITSGVVVVKDPETGVHNMSIHRLQVIDRRKLAIRLVPRHLYHIHRKSVARGEELEVAILIGATLDILLAASTSTELGVDEREIASTIRGKPLKVVRCVGKDVEIPVETQFVLEGRITFETVEEGPFPDVTGTYDEVRQQPVVELDLVTRCPRPVYHAILPGGYEHRLLMGLPREPMIYRSVSRVVPKIHGVRLTEGGCCWLHAVIAIEKQHDGDGKNAILAAFAGHPSLKHVVVVDSDVDIWDEREVEYTIATRVQADRDLVVIKGARGSSLDPSSLGTGITAKLGVDATTPAGEKERYRRVLKPG
ncbi:MAG: UbiD family decarboxylase [Methanobacteriota archaeon]|nr:MAG: UbiD family decarboxylase [Euryarchaeota archaeon]